MITVRVAVDNDAIVATATNRRRNLGEWRVSRTPERLTESIAAMLRRIPRSQLRRSRVMVTLSPPDIQVKRIEGLPPGKGIDVLQRLVEQQPARFFIGSSTSVRVKVALIGSEVVAAKYDGTVVEEIQAACANAKAVLQTIAPTPNAMTPAGGDPSKLAWHPPKSTRSRSALMRVVGLAACFLCAVGAMSAKGLRATFDHRRAEAFIASIGQSAGTLDSADAEFRRAQAVDAELARFRAGRRSLVALLGSLAVSLPESTAIESLRADSSGALLTVVSTDISDVVAALLDDPYFFSVQLEGRVAEEASRGTRLQRSTMRLVMRTSAARGRQRR